MCYIYRKPTLTNNDTSISKDSYLVSVCMCRQIGLVKSEKTREERIMDVLYQAQANGNRSRRKTETETK